MHNRTHGVADATSCLKCPPGSYSIGERPEFESEKRTDKGDCKGMGTRPRNILINILENIEHIRNILEIIIICETCYYYQK